MDEAIKDLEKGEIGWGGFIGEINALMHGMESECNKHWKDSHD